MKRSASASAAICFGLGSKVIGRWARQRNHLGVDTLTAETASTKVSSLRCPFFDPYQQVARFCSTNA
jgi:hypothetical protein